MPLLAARSEISGAKRIFALFLLLFLSSRVLFRFVFLSLIDGVSVLL